MQLGMPTYKTYTIQLACQNYHTKTQMKKAFAIVIIVTLFAVPAIAQVLMRQDGLTYTLYNLGGTPYAEVSGQSLTESTAVTIPSTITNEGIEYIVASISNRAFEHCTFLTAIDIPESITTIGNDAFFCCTKLSAVKLPNSLQVICEHTFSFCTSLSSINLPSSVTAIGNGAFWGCNSLAYVNIPSSVTTIDEFAFDACSSLTSIDIPDSVTKLGSFAFCSCDALRSVKLSDSLNEICDGVFRDCSVLSDIDIPSSISTIGNEAFQNCSALTAITLPNSVKTIGEAAFNQCSSLTAVDIPCSITDIGSGAFGACSQLAEINYNTHDPILLPIKDIFSDDTYLWGALNVPVGTIDIFRNSAPWSYFEIIKECDFSGIEEAATDLAPNTPVAVYNLNGVKVADSTVNLPAGTYIVSQDAISKKITIK